VGASVLWSGRWVPVFCGLVGGCQCFGVTHFVRLQDRIELGQAVDKSMNRHAAVELQPD
jgi:hypothetical protein